MVYFNVIESSMSLRTMGILLFRSNILKRSFRRFELIVLLLI